MRSRALVAAVVGVGALAVASVFAPAASAHPGGGHPTTSSSGVANVCFKNMSARTATGVDIPSNNYDNPNSNFDSQAADDFTLTAPCRAREIDVAGTFDQASVLDWENVYIYPDAGGRPGSQAIWVQTALMGAQGKEVGDFKIRFGPLMLQPGTYWLSVQTQLKSGRWGWDNTSTGVGSPAVFQNPDQGFPGCPTWTAIQTCFAGTPGPDLMFTIRS